MGNLQALVDRERALVCSVFAVIPNNLLTPPSAVLNKQVRGRSSPLPNVR
jgi:hypothetical protein